MEQIRIVKEMRKKYAETHGANEPVRPRFMVWENVPGAFSSNGGKDFQTVLTEIVRISEPNAVNVPLFGGGANVGLKPGCLWESEPTDSRFPLPTEYTMRNFGEYPNEERESRLSQILEVSPHPKYYLSAKACQGILNRAKRRGKELPKMLLDALTRQASVFRNEPENQGGAKES